MGCWDAGWPPLFFFCSFLFLQFHQPFRGRPVPQLPRGLRQPSPLCLAHSGPTWEPHTPGLQRHWCGASVWLPGHQGWGHCWGSGPGHLLWKPASLIHHKQWPCGSSWIPDRPLHREKRLQHHFYQWVFPLASEGRWKCSHECWCGPGPTLGMADFHVAIRTSIFLPLEWSHISLSEYDRYKVNEPHCSHLPFKTQLESGMPREKKSLLGVSLCFPLAATQSYLL